MTPEELQIHKEHQRLFDQWEASKGTKGEDAYELEYRRYKVDNLDVLEKLFAAGHIEEKLGRIFSEGRASEESKLEATIKRLKKYSKGKAVFELIKGGIGAVQFLDAKNQEKDISKPKEVGSFTGTPEISDFLAKTKTLSEQVDPSYQTAIDAGIEENRKRNLVEQIALNNGNKSGVAAGSVAFNIAANKQKRQGHFQNEQLKDQRRGLYSRILGMKAQEDQFRHRDRRNKYNAGVNQSNIEQARVDDQASAGASNFINMLNSGADILQSFGRIKSGIGGGKTPINKNPVTETINNGVADPITNVPLTQKELNQFPIQRTNENDPYAGSTFGGAGKTMRPPAKFFGKDKGVNFGFKQPQDSYDVQAGDSLSQIAQAQFGDANRWREIYELNKDIISDPNKIQVGQKLKMPGGQAPLDPMQEELIRKRRAERRRMLMGGY